MNFCGVICEFNPFHNGHNYLISEAKKLTGTEIVCLMSGNFVQRGIPAICSKYERAKIAIGAFLYTKRYMNVESYPISCHLQVWVPP